MQTSRSIEMILPIFEHLSNENRELRSKIERLEAALYEIAYGDESVPDFYREIARNALDGQLTFSPAGLRRP